MAWSAAPTRALFWHILMTLFQGARYSTAFSHLAGFGCRLSLTAHFRSFASALRRASSAVM